MPVARGDLGQQRQHGVAEVPRARDQLPGLAGEEAVRLGVVDLAAGHRADQRLEVAGSIWLSAAITAIDVDAVGERLFVAGDDRGADAAVPLVAEHRDALAAGRLGRGDGAVA